MLKSTGRGNAWGLSGFLQLGQFERSYGYAFGADSRVEQSLAAARSFQGGIYSAASVLSYIGHYDVLVVAVAVSHAATFIELAVRIAGHNKQHLRRHCL